MKTKIRSVLMIAMVLSASSSFGASLNDIANKRISFTYLDRTVSMSFGAEHGYRVRCIQKKMAFSKEYAELVIYPGALKNTNSLNFDSGAVISTMLVSSEECDSLSAKLKSSSYSTPIKIEVVSTSEFSLSDSK